MFIFHVDNCKDGCKKFNIADNFPKAFFGYLLSCLSGAPLFATPCTVAHQAPLSMESTRQEYWSQCPRPSPAD